MGIKHSRPVPPFMRYCSAIIPTMFDDSLSYYEALCALNRFIQTNLVDVINNNASVTQEYIHLVDELKEYVEHYFDNLDVQTEINNKLDAMAQDGTLGELLNSYMKPYIDSELAKTTQHINDLYEQLSQVENLSPKGAYSTVSALESANPATGVYIVTGNGHIYSWIKDGSATDLGAYQTAVNNITTEILNQDNWNKTNINGYGYKSYIPMESGSITNTGSETANSTRLRSLYHYRIAKNDQINANIRYGVAAVCYNADGEALGFYPIPASPTVPQFKQMITGAEILNAYEGVDNVRIIFRQNSNAEVEPTDSTKMQIIQTWYFATKALKDALSSDVMYFNDYSHYNWSTDGSPVSNNARLASDEFIDLSFYTKITSASGYEFALACWDKSTLAWIGYVKTPEGTTQSGGFYMGELDVTSLPTNRLYKVVFRNAIDTSAELDPLTDYNKCIFHFKQSEIILENISVSYSGVEITNGANEDNPIWTDYNGRLAFGMNTETAKVPTINNSQFLNYGTLMTMKNGGNNRWGYHNLECYDNSNFDRVTLLTDKHTEFGSKVAEFYYFTGTNHNHTSYAMTKIGSDVKDHSFYFNRDEFVANGLIDAKSVVQLARINPTTDIITTYNNYTQADQAYEANNPSTSQNNLKCCRYIQLKNAENGAMFYDTNRDKLVCKVNGKWSDVQVTPVPDGTYPF